MEAMFDRERVTGEDHGSRTVGNARRVASGERAGFREYRLEFAQLFESGLAEWVLIAVEDTCARLACERHGDDFFLKPVGRNRGGGTGLGGERELILLIAGDLVLLSQNLGGFTHHHLSERAEKAVAVHAVDEFLVAEAVSPACAVEIIGQARHRFGAAGESALKIAGCDFLVGECDRLHPRGAGLVYGVRWDGLRHAAADGNLARRIGSTAGLARIAKDGLLHLRGLDAGALHGSFRRDHAHIGGAHGGERASELANGCAHRGENEYVAQNASSKLLSLAVALRGSAGVSPAVAQQQMPALHCICRSRLPGAGCPVLTSRSVRG